MGRPWADHDSWELVDEASEVAERDVAALLLDADADELRDTRNAQLTTFVSSLIVLDAAERLGLEPSVCAGHSLGEYTALTATGALSFDEGVRLVVERADAMHQAGIDHPGTMAAVLGLDDDLVEVACRRADSDVWVANFNAPGQVVIAGSPDGVAAAGARRQGARRQEGHAAAGVRRVPHAVHGPGARPAAQGDRRRQPARHRGAGGLQRRRRSPTTSGAEWASLLSAQLSSPVRWKHCLLTLAELGVTSFAELGPGGVLTGMAKRTVDDARTISVATPEELDKLLEWVNAGATHERRAVRGRAPVRRRAPRRQPGRRACSSPPASVADGATIEVGSVLGHIGDTEVRSAFAGVLQSYIAMPGERVTLRQPIAWLRTN